MSDSASRTAGRLLDVGSASGLQTAAMAERASVVVALDINRDELTKLLAAGRAPTVVPLQADAGQMPFPAGSFSELALFEVLEHVDDPARVIAECARCLEGSGRLELSVPTSYTERLYWRLHPLYRAQSTHLRIFDRTELTELLESCGFRIERSETRYFVPMIAWAIHSLLRTPADHTGQVLKNQWVDRATGKVVGALRRLPLIGAGISSLSSRYGKSWWFSCVKAPSL